MHMLTSIIVFSIVLQTTTALGKYNSLIFSTIVACLFAVYPINAEVVAWQCTSVCAFFFFLSLSTFIQYEKIKSVYLLIASIICCLLAILSKENAIVLPAIASLYYFLMNDNSATKERIILSLKAALPLWLVAGIYCLTRTLVLGNLTASYVGPIGDSLYSLAMRRWLSANSWLKLAYPINTDIISSSDIIIIFLQSLYVLSALIILIKVSQRKLLNDLSRVFVFYILFFVISLLPLYQVWYIGDKLNNSRHFYLAAAPFIAFLTSIVFSPFTTNNIKKLSTFFLPIASLLILLAYIACFIIIDIENNKAWVEAGEQIKQFQLAVERKASESPDKKLMILNLPHEYKGVYIVGEFRMLQDLLRPPLSKSDLSQQIDLLEAYNFNSQYLLNLNQFKQLVVNKNRYKFFIWSCRLKDLQELKIEDAPQVFPAITINQPVYSQDKSNLLYKLETEESSLSPICIDTLKIQLKAKPKVDNTNTNQIASISISWLNARAEQISQFLGLPEKFKIFGQEIVCDDQSHTYTFHLSQYKNWSLAKKIPVIKLFLPANGFDFQIEKIAFSNGNDSIPQFSIDTNESQEIPGGLFSSKNKAFKFNYDVSKIAGAKKAILEISKPNSTFVIFSGNYRDNKLFARALKRIVLNSPKGSIKIAKTIFPKPGEYTLRLVALSDDEEIIGYFSDPIVVSNFQR